MTKTLALKGWVLGIIALLTFIPFGFQNVMIAIASILLIPELAKDDYVGDVWKKLLKVVGTCFILSMAASVFSFNIYIGSILTLIIGFGIYYFYTFDDRESTSMIYMVYYLFIVSIPMSNLNIPLRMGATVYGALLAMFFYYALFKVDFVKLANKSVKEGYEILLKAIDKKLIGEEYSKEMILALNSLQKAEDKLIKKAERVSKDKYNIAKKEISLDIMKSFGNVIYKSNDEILILELKNLIGKINEFYNDLITFEELKRLLKVYTEHINGKPNNYSYKLIRKTIEVFINNYTKLTETKNYYLERESYKNIAKKYSSDFNLNYKFKATMKSIKFNLALKGSIVSALVVFIIFYFKIPQGRWILYTIAVAIYPFTENSVKKFKDRIWGTTIGFILSAVLLTISQNEIYLIALILICLYFEVYIVNYNKRAIFITFTAIAGQYIATKTIGYYSLIGYRLAFVIVGAAIGYIVVKYLWPTNMRSNIEDLKESYDKLNDILIKNMENQNQSIMPVKDILVINRLLWIRASYVNSYMKNEKITEMLNLQSFIVGDYKYLSRIGNLDSHNNEFNELNNNIKKFKSFKIS